MASSSSSDRDPLSTPPSSPPPAAPKGVYTQLDRHFAGLKDAVTGGPVTEHTTLIPLDTAANDAAIDLAGTTPAVDCQIILGDRQLLPPAVDSKPSPLRLSYNRLLLAPMIRIEYRVADVTLVLEFHFNEYGHGLNKTKGLKDYHLSEDSVLSFKAYGATCSGFSKLQDSHYVAGTTEALIIEELRSLLEPSAEKEVRLKLHDHKLSEKNLGRITAIRSCLPGGRAPLLPSFDADRESGVPEYAGFGTVFQGLHTHERIIDRCTLPYNFGSLLGGRHRLPMVPQDCDSTFRTVQEAAIELSFSAMVADTELFESLRLWAKGDHRGVLYDVDGKPVVAIKKFGKFWTLDGDTFKLPNKLEVEMYVPSDKGRIKVFAVLLPINPGLPYHDAFFRITSSPMGNFRTVAYTPAQTRVARGFFLDMTPHYNSFTLSAQLRTVSQLGKLEEWHDVLLNQHPHMLPEVDTTTRTTLSPEDQAKLDETLQTCKPWNAEQLAVINNVTKTKGRLTVVMGPAGTGKTLLYKALSLYYWCMGFHVLALAPAHSNADHIARQLAPEELLREFPEWDLTKFDFIRLVQGSRDIDIREMNDEQAKHKRVGHADGEASSFREIPIALEEQDNVRGTAREQSVVHKMLRAAQEAFVSGKLPFRQALVLIKEIIAMHWHGTLDVKALDQRYFQAYKTCKAHIIGSSRFIIVPTNNACSSEMLQWFYDHVEGVPRAGVVAFMFEASREHELSLWNGVVSKGWADAVVGVFLFCDDKRLKPPSARSTKFSVFGKRLDISLPERLAAEGFPCFKLKEQFRIHASLQEFPNRHIYGGELRNGPDTFQPLEAVHPGLHGVLAEIIVEGSEHGDSLDVADFSDEDVRLHWVEVEVDGDVIKKGNSRAFREHVDVFFSKILPKLQVFFRGREMKVVDNVMIICAYSYAVELYKQRISDILRFDHDLTDDDMPRVMTVDASQTKESLMVILDGTFQSGKIIGFMNNQARVNVAMTRAKDVFWVIGGRMIPDPKDKKNPLITKYKNQAMDQQGRTHRFTAERGGFSGSYGRGRGRGGSHQIGDGSTGGSTRGSARGGRRGRGGFRGQWANRGRGARRGEH